MSIRVNPSKAVVSSISYLEPEFRASWMEVQVEAACSFPDVLAVDVVTPVDAFAHSFTKSLRDLTSGFSDTAVLDFGKNPSDVVTLEDAVDVTYWIDKHLADLQEVADAVAVATAKPFTDSFTEDDLAELSTVKALADTIDQPTEFVARVIYKSLADSVSFMDAAAAFKLFIREFDESLTTPDTSSWTTNQPETEVATTSDSSLIGVDKNLSEGLNLIDDMDGDVEYAFIKVIGELLVSSDIQVIDFTTNKADNVLTGSSGVVVMQDYSDITYFLTDYVGTSRTFT